MIVKFASVSRRLCVGTGLRPGLLTGAHVEQALEPGVLGHFLPGRETHRLCVVVPPDDWGHGDRN